MKNAAKLLLRVLLYLICFLVVWLVSFVIIYLATGQKNETLLAVFAASVVISMISVWFLHHTLNSHGKGKTANISRNSYKNGRGFLSKYKYYIVAFIAVIVLLSFLYTFTNESPYEITQQLIIEIIVAIIIGIVESVVLTNTHNGRH